MQQFRRFVRGPVGKVLLAAIILPFVISGFYGYFASGGSQGAVAEVEGNKITRAYVNSRTERLRQMIRQQSPNVSESMLDSFVRPRMVLEGIINEQLVAAAAHKANMAFSDVQAARLVRSTDVFKENGQFSEQKFENLVRAQGMSPRGYLDGLRQDHLSEQYRDGFRATGFALSSELAANRRLQGQTRDLRYAVLDVDKLRQQAQASDKQVAAYYKAHQGDFMRPEQYKLQYVEVDPADYQDRIKISDEQVEAEYKARKAMRESSSARRDVADILIAVNDQRSQKQAVARAKEARKALAGGQSFAEVARKYSDDASTADNGGNLGTLGKGALPPKLETVLDRLKVGDVSQPIVADSGVHLLKILKEDRQTMPPLKRMHDQIVADLRKGKAEAKVSEDASRLEDLAYEHNDLQQPAKQIDLTVQTTDWTGLDNLPGALNNDKVRKALQSDSVARKGHNSDLLEVGSNHYVVVHLEDTKPPKVKPLEQVSDQIRATLNMQQAMQEIRSLNEKARTAVKEKNADLEKVAGILNAKIETANDVKRGASTPARELVTAAFGAPRPQGSQSGSVQFVTLGDGSLAVFQVTGVTDGSDKGLDQDSREKMMQQLAQSEGQQSFQQVMEFLHSTLDVTIHADRLSDSDKQQDDAP